MVGQHVHPICGERRASQLGNFAIFANHDPRPLLNLGDVRTQSRKTLCQFTTDRATAQHHQARRRRVQLGECFPQRVAGDVAHLIQTGQRRHERPRTGGNDDAARGEHLSRAIVQFYFHCPRVGDARIALQHFHAQAGIAFHAVVRCHGADHLLHTRHHLAKAELCFVRLQPIMIGVTYLMRQLGTSNQCLTRHATVVEAIASHLVRLDQRHLGLDHRRDVGGHQPTRSAADHDQIAVESCREIPFGINAAALQPGRNFFGDHRKNSQQYKRK